MSEHDAEFVRGVLRSHGLYCGDEFDVRYVSDPWIFNLVNIIEQLAIDNQNLRDTLKDAGSALSQAEAAAKAYQLDLRDARAEARHRGW